MHKLDNICSSSVYGFVLRFAPERGQMPHAPPKLVPKRAIFGYFFARRRHETNCVNYARSFKFVHRLGEPAADQLRGHLEQCISDRHTSTLSRSWSGVAPLTEVAKSCLCELHNISSWCTRVWFPMIRPWAEPDAPRPSKTGPGPFSGTFSPMNNWKRLTAMNYKYCLVDAPGVSNSCLERGASCRPAARTPWTVYIR